MAMKRPLVFKLAKGFRGRAKNNWSMAVTRVEKGLSYAFRDRRNKKRDVRAAWIMQINAASRQHGMKYSNLMFGLDVANVLLNRKVLAELAVNEPLSFQALTDEAKKHAPWQDVRQRRLTDDEILRLNKRFAPLEERLPESWHGAIKHVSTKKERFAPLFAQMAKAVKKTEAVNVDLIKTGKVILPKIEPRLYGRDKKLAKKKAKSQRKWDKWQAKKTGKAVPAAKTAGKAQPPAGTTKAAPPPAATTKAAPAAATKTKSK